MPADGVANIMRVHGTWRASSTKGRPAPPHPHLTLYAIPILHFDWPKKAEVNGVHDGRKAMKVWNGGREGHFKVVAKAEMPGERSDPGGGIGRAGLCQILTPIPGPLAIRGIVQTSTCFSANTTQTFP